MIEYIEEEHDELYGKKYHIPNSLQKPWYFLFILKPLGTKVKVQFSYHLYIIDIALLIYIYCQLEEHVKQRIVF